MSIGLRIALMQIAGSCIVKVNSRSWKSLIGLIGRGHEVASPVTTSLTSRNTLACVSRGLLDLHCSCN